MSSKHLKQFSFQIDSDQINHGGFTLIEIEAHAFQHPTELLSVVNQSGFIKIHGICDQNSPVETYTFAIVGTGATIPSEYIDGLFKIGQILLNDNRHGYHFYLLSELRGVVGNGSDAGLKPVFSVKVSVDLYDLNSRDVLEDFVDNFCAAHPTVIRAHKDDLDKGLLELFVYNDEFRHQPEFSKLMSYLFTAKGATNVTVGTSV